MISDKCFLEARHIGAMMAMAKRSDANEIIYMGAKDGSPDVIVGMAVWLTFDMRLAEFVVAYNKKEDHFIETISLAPFGFEHKKGERDLTTEMTTAYVARFEKNGNDGDIIAYIPDLEKGHENPYVIALMQEAWQYYDGAKQHMIKAEGERNERATN